MEREEVRALIRSHRPSSGAGYPEVVRTTVVAYTQQCRAQGQRWAHIGAAIGLSSTTLVNWSQPQGTFLPVDLGDRPAEARAVETTALAIAPSRPVPPGGLVLHTPDGFRLEGLDLHQALALLQGLR